MPEPTDEQLANALRKRMPAPDPRFEASLRTQLNELYAGARRPKALWPLIVAYLLCGTVLLLIAAFGA